MNPSIENLHSQLASTVKGAEISAVELIAAVLADGHVLIEGAPGVGKTTLAKTFADSISLGFKRVQFTPDLLPSDLLGYSMFRQDQQQFEFIEGPVFTNLLLADEINRTSPRIQSALLECMNERQVTIDGKTHDLPNMFHVVATRNNKFASGTFPLPEPQLDRFIASIEMSLPEPGTQVAILEHHLNKNGSTDPDALISVDELLSWKQSVANLPVAREICEYIIRLCEALRRHKEIETGLSNRAAIGLTRMSQAIGFLNDHPAVYPDDVKRAFIPVMAHRIVSPEGSSRANDQSSERQQAVSILNSILTEVVVD